MLFRPPEPFFCILEQQCTGVYIIIIHPILLSNQNVPVAPGDFKIKSHIRTAVRQAKQLTQ